MLLVFLFNKFWFNLHAFVQDQQEMRSADSIRFRFQAVLVYWCDDNLYRRYMP